jgi:hypothetical protein
MARATRTLQNTYGITFESEGRRWIESHKAAAIYDAELHANSQARLRRIRVVSTLPLNPED